MAPVCTRPQSEPLSDDAELDEAVGEVLSLPSGTTLRTLLLATMVSLSAVQVGQWTYICATVNPDTEAGPPLPWLLLPPAATLVAALVATWLTPRWLELRRGWRPVPPDRGTAALARFEDLVAEMGLRTKPELVWNPLQENDRALTYGRPGSYRVALSPTLLSAARRRPVVFDAVVRHELAHVRHGDVMLAYFVITLWYAFVVLLVGSFLVLELTVGAYLTPALLLRGGILALTVYWVRAQVLRRRERYADLRAADTATHRQALVTTLADGSAETLRRRRFALHPPADERVAALSDPRRLGRIEPVEMFAVGLTGAWGTMMLWQLIQATGLWSIALDPAGFVQLALVGAYVGATLVRWTGCGVVDATGGLAPAAGGLLLGLTVGATMSVGRSGLSTRWTGQVAADGLTAVVLAGFFLWSADLARRGGAGRAGAASDRRWATATILATATVFGLAAASTGRVGIYILGEETQTLVDNNIFVMASGPTLVLTVATPVIGVVALARHGEQGWGTLRTTVVRGLGFAVVGTLTIALIRQGVDPTHSDVVARYYVYATMWTAVWTAVLAAVSVAASGSDGRLLAGVTAAVITTAGMALGYLLVENLIEQSRLPASAMGSARYTCAAAVLVCPAVAGAFWLAARSLPRTLGRRWVRTGGVALAVVTAIAVPVIVAPPVVTEAPQRTARAANAAEAELRTYLEHQVQSVGERRAAALEELQGTVAMPPDQAAQRIREAVLPRYHDLLADLDDDDLSHAPARKVRDALRAAVSAEEDLVYIREDVLEGRADQRTYAEVAAEFDAARAAWEATWRAALAQVQD